MRRTLGRLSTLAAALFLACAAASAQDRGRLRLESLDALGSKAAETVNVDIDGILIKLAGTALSDEDREEKDIKELVAGLRGVYVRSYEFKAAGQYADSDLSQIRSQLNGPGWSRVMSFKTRGDDADDAEVYAARDGDRIEGLAILVAEPREVTVVNLVGSIDPAKLQRLVEGIRLPRIRVERKRGDGGGGKRP